MFLRIPRSYFFMKSCNVWSFDPSIIIFNSNKSKDLPITGHLKPTKDDKDNPFGALIKANGQTHYIDENGKDQISVVNKVRE